MSDSEDYEALRAKNIAERNAYLAEFLAAIKEDTAEINKLENERIKICEKEIKKAKTPNAKRRSYRRKSPSYEGRRYSELTRDYVTRSKTKLIEEGENDEKDVQDLLEGDDIIVPKKRSLKIMFSWSRPMQRDLDLMKHDYEEYEENSSEHESDEDIFQTQKRKRSKVFHVSKSAYDPSTIPSADEITPYMLDNIAKKLTKKKYDAANGTSCHQCRQKTKDTKTVCRSGECIGVRGQFCGPCLMGRYGESAHEALKDPDWACPPCRGLCNCSICRTRNGQRPTGILAPIAREEGFDSVKDYLQARDLE